jgi:hypothetical protein
MKQLSLFANTETPVTRRVSRTSTPARTDRKQSSASDISWLPERQLELELCESLQLPSAA